MSGASVLIYPDRVLKIQKDCNMAQNEARMMTWLQGKLPVPQVVAEETDGEFRYLLMTRMEGVCLYDERILDDQEKLAGLMAEGLHRLWALDVTGCPARRTLDEKFREIEAGLRGGWITREQAGQPDTYGPGGFAGPAALFDWLVRNRPREELVCSHGDYCLPNLLAVNDVFAGYIDLGLGGLADKWVDIEKGLWSMWANTTGVFGGKKRPFDRKPYFAALGVTPDDDKLRYYSLLNELC